MISDTPLIASDDIEGTKVLNLQGDTIAHIDHLMIDRNTGLAGYAVIHFGGFLSMGEETRTIPWRKLSYDDKKYGYVIDITKEQLNGAPERKFDWHRDRDWEKRTHEFYAVKPYWDIF